MSKWTEIRDAVVDELKVDATETVKQDVTKKILDEVLPSIEKAVTNFTDQTRAQAKEETGWCRIRDGIVLPIVREGGIYVVKLVLEKTITQTAA